MWYGSVVSIHIAPTVGAPMAPLDHVRAIAGKGLEGDRYFTGEGFYSWFAGPLREVSLIEEEVLERVRRDSKLDLAPGITRRNVVTRGVPLGHLIGREFRVGEAILRGVEICEPCKHLIDVTGIRGILAPLIHRGGLHAEVVASGIVRVGDTVTPEPA